ncbi:MAG: ATP-binding protein [Planctomycetaceae bacterium]|jgi:hypothetical protein|nr:ATP-binding protein [Planctomycetaceae bacterium]
MSHDRKLPIGVQDFEKLRLGENIYVDKTSYIYQLAQTDAPYFLSRPRRFGKSLFLSTLKAYFLGKKELFEGLVIAELEKDWLEYPVFYIDMNVGILTDADSLLRRIHVILDTLEKHWGMTVKDRDPATRFESMIRSVYEKTERKVVILVDEYDKPLINTLDNAEINQSMRDILKGFYGVLKSADAYLRFVFLTGVTKFSKISIFSDLNHLKDISLNRKFAGICGISETELIRYFQPEIKKLSEEVELSYEETLAQLKKHFNGYHFCEDTEGMYNPFSLFNTFDAGHFRNYWYSTGTPTFLIQMLHNGNFEIKSLENDVVIPANSINDYRPEYYNPVPILYQSGYLTIKDYDTKYNEYTLGFPNEEVKYSFLNDLLPTYVPQHLIQQNFSASAFVKQLEADHVDGFMTMIRAFYASISYEKMKNEKKDEQYYQLIFYLLITLMGQFVETEVKDSAGRADAVVKTSKTIFVFEFKMANHGTAEDALAQIDSKGYLIPYTADGRNLVKVGAEFSETERTVSRWKVG